MYTQDYVFLDMGFSFGKELLQEELLQMLFVKFLFPCLRYIFISHGIFHTYSTSDDRQMELGPQDLPPYSFDPFDQVMLS